MYSRKIFQAVSIVVQGRFNIDYYTPINMIHKHILSFDDLNSIVEKSNVAIGVVEYSMGDIDIRVSSNRIQVTSVNCSKIGRISLLVTRMIKIDDDIPTIKAIGINSDIVYSFRNHISYNSFIEQIVSRKTFSPIISNPLSIDFQCSSKARQEYGGIIVESISIKNIRPDSMPVFLQYSYNSNYQVDVKHLGDIFDYLSDADKIYYAFKDKLMVWEKTMML